MVVDYPILKSTHVLCVILSGAGFLLRGWWMLRDSTLLAHRLTRTLPHVVDTVLLGSAILMLMATHQSPLGNPWLAAKLAGLVVYVVLGSIALRRGSTRRIRARAFAGALVAFAYIAAVAITRNPIPWLTA